jgi:hypothetical protein
VGLIDTEDPPEAMSAAIRSKTSGAAVLKSQKFPSICKKLQVHGGMDFVILCKIAAETGANYGFQEYST